MCSADSDVLVAADWVICDTFPPANEVSPFTPELEHPPKPNVKSKDTLSSCVFTLRDFMSNLLSLLDTPGFDRVDFDSKLGDGNSVPA